MVFEDLYKKEHAFLKMTCFFFPKKHCFSFFLKKTLLFFKKLGKKKHTFFMIDKTKQKLLVENYECFSKKEMKCQELIFAEDTYLSPLWVQVQPVRAWF